MEVEMVEQAQGEQESKDTTPKLKEEARIAHDFSLNVQVLNAM
jgi:hypothetical protein